MSDDTNCPICTKEIHSSTSSRLGEILICNECHDVFNPIVNGFALYVKAQAIKSMQHSDDSRRIIASKLLYAVSMKLPLSKDVYDHTKFEIDIA